MSSLSNDGGYRGVRHPASVTGKRTVQAIAVSTLSHNEDAYLIGRAVRARHAIFRARPLGNRSVTLEFIKKPLQSALQISLSLPKSKLITGEIEVDLGTFSSRENHPL